MTDSPLISRQTPWSPARLSLTVASLVPLGAVLDISAICAASFLSEIGSGGWRRLSAYDFDAAVVAALVFLLIAKIRGLYTFDALAFPHRNLPALFFASSMGSAAVIGLLLLRHHLFRHPRSAEILFVIYALLFAPLARLVLARVIVVARKSGRLIGRKVVFIGQTGELDRWAREDGLRFGVSETARISIADTSGHLSGEDRARLALSMRLARATRATEFAILVPWTQDQKISQVLEALRASPLGVRLYPDAATRSLLQRAKGDRAHFLTLEMRRPPLGRLDRTMKRGFDLIVASAALTASAPVMAAIAVLVRITSRGPVIFKQTRRGFDGREFRIYKFRTMAVMEDGAQVRQVSREDPRVTRLGRWLRRTSLDELPQLVNVLKGDMSLIGPRPHALAHDDAFASAIREYAVRRNVKPGLSGAAQVMGLRGETRTLADMQARVARDVWYIDNWSLWLDIRLCFQTLHALVRHDAY